MKIIPGPDAYGNLFHGVKQRTFRYPSKGEAGYLDGVLLPKLNPKFTIAPGEKIFTIGSCFAREIESRLVQRGFDVPVSKFMNPEMLNEYNAGTILQRIESVFGMFTYDDGMGIEETEKGCVDLFLHIAQAPVPLDILLLRRRMIAEVYQELLASHTVVITLGLTETWFDTKYQCYVNKAPSRMTVNREPERFQFHRMDVEDVTARISNALSLISKHSQKKIVLTVSPIPIEATFSQSNAIVANSYSKAVLRVVAEKMSNDFSNVDYFPSFEMATSAGTRYYQDDNVHVTTELVDIITRHMLANYVPSQASAPAAEGAVTLNYIDGEAHNRLIGTVL
ncbi:hypothetical protein ASD15_24470 [Massilia sp. Root351]|jgi:hypothetical protein|uniref:GSCFA domain-containing protein n=1 Tax=Massilia sp. Root351 TaxID=1736522 RepID=UPI00070D487B|nr:GSCFA domain-containing protein [Massilia sp. Root351]KQV89863.1 hypothetical protein ASD15_24470 [Massilia sp. Root351]